MTNRNNKNNGFEAYPKPSQADQQLKNQPEYIDELEEQPREQNRGDAVSSTAEQPRQADNEED